MLMVYLLARYPVSFLFLVRHKPQWTVAKRASSSLLTPLQRFPGRSRPGAHFLHLVNRLSHFVIAPLLDRFNSLFSVELLSYLLIIFNEPLKLAIQGHILSSQHIAVRL